jgi:radical SAM protein with 4Fe4S-binding SPASM domain
MDRFFRALLAFDEKRKKNDPGCGADHGGILMQWHITERCNLRCSHCYQNETAGAEADLAGLMMVLEEFERLIAAMNEKDRKYSKYKTYPDAVDKTRRGVRAHITVTGGEPFIRNDFFNLLETLYERRRKYSYAILTNGTMIDRKTAEKLAKLKPGFVQISIEGGEAAHDSIRGEGSHRLAVEALENLRRAGVRTMVSFTAHKGNFRHFSDAVRTTKSAGAERIWADRLVAAGRGKALSDMTLNAREAKEFFNIMKECRGGIFSKLFSRTEISMRRSLQFLVGGREPYRCGAGETLITVMPDGEVYPCRRLPISCGNLFKTRLSDIYENDPLMKKLRGHAAADPGCEGCAYAKLCGGGARCISNSETGDPFMKDPGCWIKRLRYTFILPVIKNSGYSFSLPLPSSFFIVWYIVEFTS